MTSLPLQVNGIGWVLPAGTGCGADIAKILDVQVDLSAAAGAVLAGFSAKPYLNSVKGYLDPASSFCLAASALALREAEGGGERPGGVRERAGICTMTRYGATLSAFRFYEQFLRKGARFASPLVFPHGYASTAGNLAAIEFEFAGPHMVFYGPHDIREGLEFASARLGDGSADQMLVAAYESAAPNVLPDGTPVLPGAIALHVTATPSDHDLLTLDPAALRDMPAQTANAGMVQALLSLLSD